MFNRNDHLEYTIMFFKLLKEIPQMFAVAAIIWVFVLILFIRNSRIKDKTFFAKHRSTIIAAVVALLLTVADIWLFIEYIPTHFKKQPAAEVVVSTKDLLGDSTITDTVHKTTVEAAIKKDTSKQGKAVVTEMNGKTYVTGKASIHFLSKGSSEDIEATNHSVACSFNDKTGQLKFTGLIKGFQFENEIMQNHFNDKDYMNSDAFPKTSFTGNVQNISSVNFTKEGTYNITAAGTISIHGITKNITVPGSLTIAGGKLSLKSIFKIKRIDFGITTDEIADELSITVIAEF